MAAPAGQRREPHVALDDDDLGFLGDAGKAEPRRHLALVHHAGAGEMRVGRLVHDQRAEVAGIGQRPPHHRGVGHGAPPVAEADRASLAEKSELGDLAPLQALGDRRHRMDADSGLVAGEAADEIDQRDVVDHRVGVGHGDDGGDAAGGRRLSGRGEGLAVLGARLADEDAHVDQPGPDDRASAIDHLGAGGPRRPRRLGPGRDDPPVGNDHRTPGVEVPRRVDDPRILQHQRPLAAPIGAKG